MAIKINAGAAPQAGRITMPKGTYLPTNPFSNPSTAASGSLGGGGGTNPGTIGNVPIGGATSPIEQYRQPNFLSDFLQSVDQQMRNQPNAIDMANQFNYGQAQAQLGTTVANVLKGWSDIVKGLSNPATAATTAFTPPKNQTNGLVGTDVSASPNFLSTHQVSQIFSGLGAEQKEKLMTSKGYTRSYQAGVGEIWVKTGEGTGTSAVSGGLDARGRPEFVDPTALEPGERVTAQSGLTFVGGTPYTDPGGTTVAQYTMTIPGGANDTKGRFKWKSTVQKDADGNWVRIYRKELRKVYTRSHRKKQYQRRLDKQQQPADVSTNEVEQLVNFRANFG